MNSPLIPPFYGVACLVALWLMILWLVARSSPRELSRREKLVVGLSTMVVLVVPVGGLPVWAWAFSICPNPSMPLLGLICVALWPRLGGVRLFKAADWRATWAFGAVAGTVLYFQPVYLSGSDFYFWGWHHQAAILVLAGTAGLFLACGSRLGLLLLVALLAYEFQGLESRNAWDYVIDPVFWLISVTLGTVHFARKGFARKLRPIRAQAVPVQKEAVVVSAE